MNIRGQVNVAGSAIAAIVGIIGILIFANVYNALNTDLVSSGAVELLDLVDLLLAAVLIIGVVALLLVIRSGR